MTILLRVVTPLWFFLIIQTASRPQKKFIEPIHIRKATGPFVKDHLYVDKTDLAKELCESNGAKYFFVRPRRYGKSTFLATLEAIFDGRGPQVLNGTYIHGSDYLWGTYPVLYLDLGQAVIENAESCAGLMEPNSSTFLEQKVDADFTKFRATYNLLTSTSETRLVTKFNSILEDAEKKTGKSTVVLIDEYDFSIVNNWQSCGQAARTNAELVRDILLAMKGCIYIKFAFVTGVNKAVLSILGSGFDLNDITHAVRYHDIAGLTDADLQKYYGSHFAEVSRVARKPNDTVIRELKQWYNGYNFSEFAPSPLYNPQSVHSYFEAGSAKRYWGDHGYASFLFAQMVDRPRQFALNLKEGTESRLMGARYLNETDAALLLYDAGYITIQGFRNGRYLLRFPNLEMEEAYHSDIAAATRLSGNSTDYEISVIGSALKREPEPDFDLFMKAMNEILRKLPLRAPFEEWYNWQMYLHMGYAEISVDRQTYILLPTRKGKIIDVTGCTASTYFLFEAKFNRAGNSDAWKAAEKSIVAFLTKQKKENPDQPLNLLAAGITFTDRWDQDPVMTYQAKLYGPNGTELRRYESDNLKNGPQTASFYVDEKFEI